MTTIKILPDPSIVQLTEQFDKDWLSKNRVAKVMGQYAYDAARVTYCCEVTPSYELTLIRYEAVYDDGYEPTEAEQERIEDELREVETEPVCYFHCRTIDQIKKIEKFEDIPRTISAWRMAWNPGTQKLTDMIEKTQQSK